MNPAYNYAVEHGDQVYFYDPENPKYNDPHAYYNHAKYDMAEDIAEKIVNNPDNDFYVVGYSAGGAASVLATEMTKYSNNIKGVGLIDPSLGYTKPNGEEISEESGQNLANKITTEGGIPLALADSTKDEIITTIPSAIVPQPPQPAFDYPHDQMGTDQSVFNFIFDAIFK